jgi:hypothetical protein
MFLTRVRFHVPHLVTTSNFQGFLFSNFVISKIWRIFPQKEELVKFALGKQTFSKFPPFFCVEKTKKIAQRKKKKTAPNQGFVFQFL